MAADSLPASDEQPARASTAAPVRNLVGNPAGNPAGSSQFPDGIRPPLSLASLATGSLGLGELPRAPRGTIAAGPSVAVNSRDDTQQTPPDRGRREEPPVTAGRRRVRGITLNRARPRAPAPRAPRPG
ncbi:hypothetical protein GCM10010252_29570 [Streptomyces aureoverticillatus]|nr:hypothetical protein GCM10010252_29570 [Streptomyces aureoverticillatus]